jgi:hypothetical protein
LTRPKRGSARLAHGRREATDHVGVLHVRARDQPVAGLQRAGQDQLDRRYRVEENADVVGRFVRAMNRSLNYAQAHPDEARRVVLTYTKIPAKVARTMKLSYWSSDLSVPSIELTARDAERFGFVRSAPNVDDLIWHGGG